MTEIDTDKASVLSDLAKMVNSKTELQFFWVTNLQISQKGPPKPRQLCYQL